MPMIYLIRHAMPEYPYTGRYDIPPGPALSFQGREQAHQTGYFLADKGIRRLFHSPLLRTIETATIIAQYLHLPLELADELAEWRQGETPPIVRERMAAFWQQQLQDSLAPIGLVSHGGPIEQLLRHISRDQLELNGYRYWGGTTTPPAGVWSSELTLTGEWNLQMIFDPAAVQQPIVPYA